MILIGCVGNSLHLSSFNNTKFIAEDKEQYLVAHEIFI